MRSEGREGDGGEDNAALLRSISLAPEPDFARGAFSSCFFLYVFFFSSRSVLPPPPSLSRAANKTHLFLFGIFHILLRRSERVRDGFGAGRCSPRRPAHSTPLAPEITHRRGPTECPRRACGGISAAPRRRPRGRKSSPGSDSRSGRHFLLCLTSTRALRKLNGLPGRALNDASTCILLYTSSASAVTNVITSPPQHHKEGQFFCRPSSNDEIFDFPSRVIM